MFSALLKIGSKIFTRKTVGVAAIGGTAGLVAGGTAGAITGRSNIVIIAVVGGLAYYLLKGRK